MDHFAEIAVSKTGVSTFMTGISKTGESTFMTRPILLSIAEKPNDT